MKYIKKPVEVEAIQLKEENLNEVKKFIGKEGQRIEWYKHEYDFLGDINPQGIFMPYDKIAKMGDYIVKELDGRFYPIPEKLFLETYEMIKEPMKENPNQLSLFPENGQFSLF